MALFSHNPKQLVFRLLMAACLGRQYYAVFAQVVPTADERLSADNNTLYQLVRERVTWFQANENATSLTRDGCSGTGSLAKVLNRDTDEMLLELCPISSEECWIGLSRTEYGSMWKWSKDGEVWNQSNLDTYNGFQPTNRNPGVGCAHYYQPQLPSWRSRTCTYQYVEHYIVEFDCTPPAPPAPTMDEDWNVAFHNGSAAFDDSSAPEVALTYNASAPKGANKYYKLQVLHPDCATAAATSDGVIFPAETGKLPDSDYADGFLTAKIYINTSAIASSAIFWTAGASPGQGTIEFCAKVDLYNVNDNGIATESTKVTLEVDNAVGFSVLANFTNEAQTAEEEDVQVDYELDADFCDDNGNAVTPAPTLYPGDVLQVCISAASSGAIVVDVHSVKFVNSQVAGLTFEVINNKGAENNEQTLKDCDASSGVCRIKTVTFLSLYQYDTDSDGVLKDVSAGASFLGTAILNFGGRLNENEHHYQRRRLATVTGFDFDLGRSLELTLGDDDALASKSEPAPEGNIFVGVALAATVVAAAAAVAAVAKWTTRRTTWICLGGGVSEEANAAEDKILIRAVPIEEF